MNAIIDWAVLGTVVSVVGGLVAGVRAYGRHEEKIEQLQQARDNCRIEDIMTVTKCDKAHLAAQEQISSQLKQYRELNAVTLQPIKDDIGELKIDTKKISADLTDLRLQLSGIMGQLTTANVRQGGLR